MRKEKRKKRRKKRRRKKRGVDPQSEEGRRNAVGGWNRWLAVGGNAMRKKRHGFGRPGFGRPSRSMTSATLFFKFFSDRSCSGGFNFLIFFFFDGSWFGSCFFGFFTWL
jgi:hypothetical protein